MEQNVLKVRPYMIRFDVIYHHVYARLETSEFNPENVDHPCSD